MDNEVLRLPFTPDADSISGHRDLRLYYLVKRALDVVVSATVIVLLAPLFATLCLLIVLDSPGPALFVQKRAGYDRRRGQVVVFGMLKYRTMYNDSDQKVHVEWVRRFARADAASGARNAHTKVMDLGEDHRVTRVGRLLRRTSLDELPQFWNVLKGDMTLVGPRPVPVYEVAEYKPSHLRRLRAVPGLTGLWQVKARGQVSLDEWTEIDVDYIEHQSLLLDLKILLLTIPAMITGRGAV
jgi:lipopolysaccharide/colanic/teichoic acid biosynthesis glycosyltransferase